MGSADRGPRHSRGGISVRRGISREAGSPRRTRGRRRRHGPDADSRRCRAADVAVPSGDPGRLRHRRAERVGVHRGGDVDPAGASVHDSPGRAESAGAVAVLRSSRPRRDGAPDGRLRRRPSRYRAVVPPVQDGQPAHRMEDARRAGPCGGDGSRCLCGGRLGRHRGRLPVVRAVLARRDGARRVDRPANRVAGGSAS